MQATVVAYSDWPTFSRPHQATISDIPTSASPEAAPPHSNTHTPSFSSSKIGEIPTLSYCIFEFFAIVIVIIYVYMIKMIANMHFLLCLDMLEIIGGWARICSSDWNQESLKLSLFM